MSLNPPNTDRRTVLGLGAAGMAAATVLPLGAGTAAAAMMVWYETLRNSIMRNAAAPSTGGVICPPVEEAASTAAANSALSCPPASWSSTRTPPTAEVEKFTSSRSPRNVHGSVRSSPRSRSSAR